MKKFIKNNLLGFILGAIIFGGIGIVYAAISATGITYNNENSGLKNSNGNDITNVQDAIDELYHKTSINTDGYVALFSGDDTINTTNKNLPIIYANDKYVVSSENKIIIKEAGEYQIIGTVGHSPENSRGTSAILIYKNGSLLGYDNILGSASQNYLNYTIFNQTVTLSIDDYINVILKSDQNLSGKCGGTVIVIKK